MLAALRCNGGNGLAGSAGKIDSNCSRPLGLSNRPGPLGGPPREQSLVQSGPSHSLHKPTKGLVNPHEMGSSGTVTH